MPTPGLLEHRGDDLSPLGPLSSQACVTIRAPAVLSPDSFAKRAQALRASVGSTEAAK
jgi:hypothetical protein